MDKQALMQGADRIVPDSGAPRFIEALNEAAARFDKEKGNYFPVVVILARRPRKAARSWSATSSACCSGSRTGSPPCTSSCSRPARSSGIAARIRHAVGDAVAKNTGGRYDNIAAATRLATLLPEIGAQIAKSHARQSRNSASRFSGQTARRAPSGRLARQVRARVDVDADDQRTAAVTYNPSDS